MGFCFYTFLQVLYMNLNFFITSTKNIIPTPNHNININFCIAIPYVNITLCVSRQFSVAQSMIKKINEKYKKSKKDGIAHFKI